MYNYLFANANKGQFIVRIENIGQPKSNALSQQSIFDGLRWAGINAAESVEHGGAFGPYETSQRSEIYRANAEKLLKNESAYYCFCSKEHLEAQEKAALKTKGLPKYDNKCRHLNGEEVAAKLKENAPKQIRLVRLFLVGILRSFGDFTSLFGVEPLDTMNCEGFP